MLIFIGIIIALILLAFGETMKNETKKEYVEKWYNWNAVLFFSNLAGIIGGLSLAIILIYNPIDSTWNPMFLPFAATIATYITVQSFMTDLRILLINRKILRVSYVAMYIISIYNILSNDNLRQNWLAVALFTVLLMLIFIFSSIGASDVRAIAVLLPYVISIGGYDAILMFSFTLLLVALFMGLRNIIRDRKRMKKFKQDNIEVYNKMNKIAFYKFARDLIRDEKTEEEKATPVGPYMIAPFVIFLFIFPFIVN